MDLPPLPEAFRPRERQTRDVPQKKALLLGLSIRRHSVGYALMRFVDTAPFQFGLVDVGKADDVQQKALEISAVLRDLKSKGCQKMATELLDGVIPEPPPKGWRWFVSVDDSTLDRAPPRSSKDSGSQRAIAMLQGLVIADCKRIFKNAPMLIHPRRSRLHFGVRGVGPSSRMEVLTLARKSIPEFPVVNHKSGALDENTLLMSDAWASARYAQRVELVQEKKKDPILMEKIRRKVLGSKQLQRMSDVVEQLHPRNVGRDMAAVLESRVQRLIDTELHNQLAFERRELRRKREDAAAEKPEF